MAVLGKCVHCDRMDFTMQFQLPVHEPPTRIEPLGRHGMKCDPLEAVHVEDFRAEHSRLHLLAVFC